MGVPVRVLILEDRPTDAKLMVEELRRGGFEPVWKRVDTEAGYRSELDKVPDIILADYEVPSFGASLALQALQERGEDIPFIVITGTMNDEEAAGFLKRGAADYLLKDRMARLAQAVGRAFEDKKQRGETRRQEAALRESEDRFRLLAENSPDIIYRYRLAPTRGFEYVSPACRAVIGYEPEVFYQDPDIHLRFVHPDDRKFLDGSSRPRSHDPIELRFTGKDGDTVWIEWRSVPIYDNAGKLIAVQGVARDITGRKRTQESLRESEARFRTIFEDAPVGIALVGSDLRILKSNRCLSNILGHTEEELISLTIDGLTHPDDIGNDMDLADRLMRGDIPGYRLETRLLGKDGKVRYGQVTTALIRDQEGQPVHGLAMVEDITERKLQEERIRRQLDRLSALRTIDMAISSSLDRRTTFGVLLDQALTQLNVDAATVLLLDPRSHYLRYAAGRGFRTDALQHTSLRLGEGHAGRAALERSNIAVDDLAKTPGDFARSPLFPGEGFVFYRAAPLIAKGQVKGVMEVFKRSPFEPGQEWLDFLEALAGQAAIAIDNATLFDDLQRSNAELSLAYDTTLEGWARAVDLRDKETEGHSQRVAELAVRLGRAVGMSEADLVHVRRGALLHDIGKLGVPDSILLKPGPLTDEEWEIMRKHPVYAYEMLASVAFLRPALDVPYCHHEKWGGMGYPRGLKGEQIPLMARIFAVVDVTEALSSDRPYRAAWPKERVREYIAERAGTEFDPRVVRLFLEEGLL